MKWGVGPNVTISCHSSQNCPKILPKYAHNEKKNMGVASLLSTFPPSWNVTFGPTPHYITSMEEIEEKSLHALVTPMVTVLSNKYPGETYLTALETSPGFLNRSLLEPCGLFKSLMPAANLDAEPGVEKSAEDKGVPVINCYQYW